ncbi:plasmid pRiA4b ORF-3 family protein [Allomesorhizobium camelthorni]|uniref:Plasmid pRiA4b ORF-3 family protein n=1 Tax=Allomesorhizobium camelthorni TaxID=475069 RepID=A0A6G4WJH3_9HYPH|nr:plasmid pRiA4b ORF-3 family protein [Mesorhizobium camelthorni]NGO54764.1 plasmid pRiA4b ORF-3 family protein [Mesorhizobium camelthorni]
MPKMYEIRIELLDLEPVVWRTVLVPDDMPLVGLAAVVQGAVGWQASHMFGFEIDGKRYDIKLDDDDLDDQESLAMEGVIVRDVLRPGVDALFQYDFGDDWWHRLDVLAHREIAKGDKPPRCLEGARAGPPEDCGGPYGYLDMLDIAGDPEHPDHADIREWLGDFDPEKFDVRKANREISKIVKVYAGMMGSKPA